LRQFGAIEISDKKLYISEVRTKHILLKLILIDRCSSNVCLGL